MKFTVEMTKKEFDSLDEDTRQIFMSNTSTLSVGNEEILREVEIMMQQLADQFKALAQDED